MHFAGKLAHSLVAVVQSLSQVWLLQPLDCSTPSTRQEFAQAHFHWVGDAIYPSHPLLPPSPSAFKLSQHQGSMSQLFRSSGQSIGASAFTSVFPMNIQSWFPLGLTGLILQSKGLSRVFFGTIIQKHQFFGTHPSLWSNPHICTWLLEKPQLWLYGSLLTKWCLCFLIWCLGWSYLSFQGASVF